MGAEDITGGVISIVTELLVDLELEVPADLEPGTRLEILGLESLHLLELALRVEEHFGLDLEATPLEVEDLDSVASLVSAIECVDGHTS